MKRVLSKSKSKSKPAVTTTPKPKPKFEVRDSAIQGKGAFALRRIPKGARIAEYEGERISEEEALDRYDDASMDRHHTFLFAVDDDISIDGAVGGNDSRFINHSCNPNCEAYIIGKGRVFIYAKRDIPKGAELTYDYSYVGVDADDPEVRAMYRCMCGSRKCRGSIVAPPKKKKTRAARDRERDDERRSRKMAS